MKNIGVLIELQRLYNISHNRNSYTSSIWSIEALLFLDKKRTSPTIISPGTYRKLKSGKTINNQAEIADLLCKNLHTLLLPDFQIFFHPIYDDLLISLQCGNFSDLYISLHHLITKLELLQHECQKQYKYNGYFFEQHVLQTLYLLQNHYEYVLPFSSFDLFFLNSIKNFFSPTMSFLIEFTSFRNLYLFSSNSLDIVTTYNLSQFPKTNSLLSTFATACFIAYTTSVNQEPCTILYQSLDTTYQLAVEHGNSAVQLEILAMFNKYDLLDFNFYQFIFHKYSHTLPHVHIGSHLHYMGLVYLKQQNIYNSYNCFLDSYRLLPNLDSKLYVFILSKQLYITLPQELLSKELSNHPSQHIYHYFRLKECKVSNNRCRSYLKEILIPLINTHYPLLIPFFLEEVKRICSHHLCTDKTTLIELFLMSSPLK